MFDRDEKKALKEKKEAAAIQIKAALEAQIEEKKKKKEEEKKKRIEEDIKNEQKDPIALQEIKEANIEIDPNIECSPTIDKSKLLQGHNISQPKKEIEIKETQENSIYSILLINKNRFCTCSGKRK